MVIGGLDLFYSVSGFVVGALVGFTGVGGGSLMTPLRRPVLAGTLGLVGFKLAF